MKQENIYKSIQLNILNMFPSDPTGSLDDFYFSKFIRGLKWKKV